MADEPWKLQVALMPHVIKAIEQHQVATERCDAQRILHQVASEDLFSQDVRHLGCSQRTMVRLLSCVEQARVSSRKKQSATTRRVEHRGARRQPVRRCHLVQRRVYEMAGCVIGAALASDGREELFVDSSKRLRGDCREAIPIDESELSRTTRATQQIGDDPEMR